MKARKGKLTRFFSWYPEYTFIRPGVVRKLSNLKDRDRAYDKDGVICIQCVPDKFFFLLFNLICHELKLQSNYRIDLIVVRSVSGAVGIGFLAALKRCSLVSWWWLSKWERAWGSDKDRIAYRCSVLFDPVNDILDWIRAKKIWRSCKIQDNKFALELGGIEVGDLLVDSYLRFRPSPKFEIRDPFVRYLIWEALRSIRVSKRYFSENKPKLYISSYSSYIDHGVSVRVALLYGVPVYTFGDFSHFGKLLTFQDLCHTTNCSKFLEEFESLDSKSTRLAQAESQLMIRINGGIDAGTSYMKQSAYSKIDSSLPDDFDGSVVVFLHDFYDSYNAYEDLIFCDFWQWVCITIEILQSSNIKFFLKIHPNQMNLNDAVLDGLKKKYPHTKWLPRGLNNLDLVKGGMTCGVTAYGTVAHELAFLGIPVIGFGRHPHHSFEFCRTAKNVDEYRSMLKSPWVMPLMKEEMKKQALMFYYMKNLYGSNDEISMRNSVMQLWRCCNVDNGTDEEILEAMQALFEQPKFKLFVRNLIHYIN